NDDEVSKVNETVKDVTGELERTQLEYEPLNTKMKLLVESCNKQKEKCEDEIVSVKQANEALGQALESYKVSKQEKQVIRDALRVQHSNESNLVEFDGVESVPEKAERVQEINSNLENVTHNIKNIQQEIDQQTSTLTRLNEQRSVLDAQIRAEIDQEYSRLHEEEASRLQQKQNDVIQQKTCARMDALETSRRDLIKIEQSLSAKMTFKKNELALLQQQVKEKTKLETYDMAADSQHFTSLFDNSIDFDDASVESEDDIFKSKRQQAHTTRGTLRQASQAKQSSAAIKNNNNDNSKSIKTNAAVQKTTRENKSFRKLDTKRVGVKKVETNKKLTSTAATAVQTPIKRGTPVLKDTRRGSSKKPKAVKTSNELSIFDYKG
ncbi:hypothetical protein AKO1_011909, partial [Acrasis kona]